jgi:two-component system, cell cycle response regulator DivK
VRRRLLIVEDSEFDRDLLTQILEDTYDIELAGDGQTAVETVAERPPNLILMDIGLPQLSGLEAARAIRARGVTTPIVAVSSGVMPEDRERAIDAGCDEFVAKPIDDLLLVDLVNRILARR